LGRVAGPLLAGVLFSRASTEAPYWVAALLAVVAVGLVPTEVKSNSAS